MGSVIPDLTREITREEYEAELLAEPLDEDGNPKPTWEELLAFKLEGTIGEWRGFVIRDA